MSAAIAIVGMACRYADARSPDELWETVLARRSGFRRLPAERLALADYLGEAGGGADTFYITDAALLESCEFDRVRHRVSASVHAAVDASHWLALDVAHDALQDAGFPAGDGLPRASTGVLVGNTLTGEFSRANALRLRWPYVRRVVAAALQPEGWASQRQAAFLRELETSFKAPFPVPGDETLAGSLSNTIAGRICNHLDLGGGGYTLDGACSSSLLAVTRACAALEAGELDAALAGGVDLSLDPLELVGFARVGALAHGDMLVYDRDSSGFLPGEGCGMVVLMRLADARAQGRRCYGIIRGWGVSSDGSGSITRPEQRGQALALERAYRHAAYGPATVALFEGHGTGTPVGDEVELRTLVAALRAAGPPQPAASLGSVKANVGHTKAAAGAAGLIKVALALERQLLPPTTGVRRPHALLAESPRVLRLLDEGEPWPENRPLRAAVSSFGFGGINVHLTLESGTAARRIAPSAHERVLLGSPQDAELFLFAAVDAAGLAARVARVAELAPRLAQAQLSDLAAALQRRTIGAGRVRAAVVADSPRQLATALAMLRQRLESKAEPGIDPAAGVFFGAPTAAPRIAFLFPGQGAPVGPSAGLWARRFPHVWARHEESAVRAESDEESTARAQPSIVLAEVAALRLLSGLGLEATVALGHSLGELAAWHWAGAFSAREVVELARVRGRLMASVPGPPGTMASLSADAPAVAELLDGSDSVAIAAYNAPRQTVVSGPRPAVEHVLALAQARGWAVHRLLTAGAFHSPLMAPAVAPFTSHLATAGLGRLQRPVVSSITGALLDPGADLRALLARQLTAPVRFVEALDEVARAADLCVEVGPGEILSHLVRDNLKLPAVALDAGGPSLRGLLSALGAAFALGADLRTAALFEDRFTRPFDLEAAPRFLRNPCEQAPSGVFGEPVLEREAGAAAPARAPDEAAGSALELVRRVLAERLELPLDAIEPSRRLLGDLRLSSLAVGEVVTTAARRLGLPPPAALDFAQATVAEVAVALERLQASGARGADDAAQPPAGVAEWVRAFTPGWRERSPRRVPARQQATGRWTVLAPAGSPGDALRQRSAGWGGAGVLVYLPPGAVETAVAPLLQGAALVEQAAQQAAGGELRFVVVQHAGVASAFVRTLHLERPEVTTCVIDVPPEPRALDWIEAELAAATGHVDVRWDAHGRRLEPCLQPLELPMAAATTWPFAAGDLLVVSGGGQGLGAACAAELARASGASLLLLGRTPPERHPALEAGLQRLREEGLDVRYEVADVTRADELRAVLARVQAERGPVAGLLHAAGVNEPCLLRELDAAGMARTWAPKVQGLRNLLAAVDPGRLRALYTFSSVIGRIGLRGEAHYALANAALSALTEEFQSRHPHCRCVALEFSVWSALGMGARLGAIDGLRHQGVTPIPAEEGLRLFRQLAGAPAPAVCVVVAGRMGLEPPQAIDGPALPLLRFLERPRVAYAGIELVVDAEVSSDSDPYVLEHCFEGQALLPAVMGLEAMVQAAVALSGASGPPLLEDVRLERPVVVEAGRPVTLRLAALARAPGRVDVVLRCSSTGFQADHFACTCVWPRTAAQAADPADRREAEHARLPLEPARDLYGGLFFQGGRFRRVTGYRHLAADGSRADIGPAAPQPWFGAYLPHTLLLGDPAARDAALHSIQACVPHALLLPVGVERLHCGVLDAGEPLTARASERWRRGDSYCYDLELRARDGTLRERWEGLRLRKVRDADTRALPEALLAPLCAWRVRELVDDRRVRVALGRDGWSGVERPSDALLRRALDRPVAVRRGADGRPTVDGVASVSASHAGDLCLAVSAECAATCDLEPVQTRDDDAWRDLLGPERWRLAGLIAERVDRDVQAAATRVWCALECLKKAGVPSGSALRLGACADDGWVVLEASGYALTSYVTTPASGSGPRLALAILTGKDLCPVMNTGTVSDSRRPTS